MANQFNGRQKAGAGTSVNNRFVMITREDVRSDSCCELAEGFFIILEKMGFLDFETTTLAEYSRTAGKSSLPHVVLLPNSVVQQLDVRDITAIEQEHVIVFAEGPWPTSWDAWLGVGIKREAGGETDVEVDIKDGALLERIDRFLYGMANPSCSGAYNGPASLQIKQRQRVPRKHSNYVSAFHGINEQVASPRWSIRPTIAEKSGGGPLVYPILARRGHDPFSGLLLFRHGQCIVSNWQVLSFLVQEYTATAKHHEYAFSVDRYPMEFLLLSVLVEALQGLFARSYGNALGGLSGFRLAPWPNAAQYALTVRHDVDRLPTEPSFSRLLDQERGTKVGVSCYFLEKTADRATMQRFAEIGAEIAYHAAFLEPEGEGEIEAITRQGYSRPVGLTVHGNEGFYGWRGAALWEVAERMRMKYCEHLSSLRYWPSRVFKIDENGRIALYSFVAMPHHLSLDRNMNESYCDKLAMAIPVMARNQMHVIVLNHPDINVDELIDLLGKRCPRGYVGLTEEAVAAWWRATHFRESFSFSILRISGDEVQIEIQADEPISGLTFEWPSTERPSEVVLNGSRPRNLIVRSFTQSALAENGWRIGMDVPRGRSTLSVRWSLHDRTMARLRQGIMEWFAADHGKPTKSAEKTAAFNSTEVDSRLSALVGPIRDILERDGEVTILDVGCGFGGFALSLASDRPSRRVRAVDISPRYFTVAEQTAQELGLRNVSFASCNILDLRENELYDVVLLSNMLCFLTSAEDLARGCENAWNATKPGGAIALYTPHVWSVREPFTRLYGLQYFPMGIRDHVARWLGRRSTMRDVRLPSARELRLIFQQLGGRFIEQSPTSWWRSLNGTHIYQWIRK